MITLLLLFGFFLLPDSSISQTADSLLAPSDDSTAQVISDSLMSAKNVQQKKSGIDSSVAYQANDTIVFTYSDKTMRMFGKTKIRYKELGLQSERISINWKTNDVEAVGVIDSLRALQTDTLKQRYFGVPVMQDGGEEYEGWKINYNFSSQKGRISFGETEMEQGYYYGQHIKKVEKDVLFIADGRYTTCAFGHPHYYFFSPRMRVIMRDKIVAEPIYLYVADVPVFALPFGVFPSQGGRRSGIIAPAFGDDARRGKFLQHFGYYEAISDYMDLALMGDWYTQGGWKGYAQFRYAKRYGFTGDLSGEYSRVLIGEPEDPDRNDEANYRTNIRHNQQINPTTRLDVDFTFASNNSYKTSNNYNDYLRQEIYSNATLSKFWEGTNNSMSVNISRRQDLREGNIDATIPSLSFSHSQSYPFRSLKRSRGYSGYSESQFSWYELVGVNYSGQFLNKNNKTKTAIMPGLESFDYYDRYGLNHSISVNASPKAGYFTITPSLQYTERWYGKTQKIYGVDTITNDLIKEDISGFDAVRFYSANISASTRFYGMFQPPVPGLIGIRHTVSPSLSFNYQPDFSESSYGYYSTYADRSGREVTYDRFQREVFGGAPAGRYQAVSLSVGNVFEMKTSASDSTQKESKYQLLNLTGSLAYNFAADSLRLSDLSLGFRTDIGQYLGISGSTTYRFYQFDQTSQRRLNRFLISDGKGIAELTNFSLSLSTSLKGEKQTRSTGDQRDTSDAISRSFSNGYRGLYDEEPPDFSIPWNLSLNFNFTQSQENPRQKFRSANVSANLGFNLTENWRFTASSSYDLTTEQFAAPRVTIYRDLHCWEMNFSWTPLGVLTGYRFELKVKAPQLQDIKVTKQSRDSGYY